MTKEEHAKVLPPLPPHAYQHYGRGLEAVHGYTADQMRDYALDAIMRKEPEPVSDEAIAPTPAPGQCPNCGEYRKFGNSDVEWRHGLPPKAGVYIRTMNDVEFYSYCDGVMWFSGESSIEEAIRGYNRDVSALFQELPWREAR